VRVRAARDRQDLRRFIDLPYRLHARDPLWVPPLRRDVEDLLSRDKNPFFEHAEAEYFVAERGGDVVGRIAAISNRLHNETHQDRAGFFGFFECIEDQGVADALFTAAGEWCKQHGHDVLRGPASFSVNDECGLLVQGFETPPVLMMPHNPRYYPKLLEEAGLTPVKDLFCYEGRAPAGDAADRVSRAAELMQKRYGITLRSLNMRDFDREVERIKQLYNEAWERNWGFVPMTDRELDHLAEQFKPVVLPDLVTFAEKDGRTVGFSIALPDLNVAFRSNRKGSFLRGVLTAVFMLKTKRIPRLRVLLLGIVPEFRGKGLDAALYHWIWKKAIANRIYWGEAGWILDDNAAMNAGMVKLGWKHYKTYRLYDRPL
jgi:GNAT superfamily N-acetyltransferase